MIKLIIPGRPITKKNNQRILMNRKTKKRFIAPSEQFEVYQEMCLWELRGKYLDNPIDYAVNVKCLYYMPSRSTVDLSNLLESTHDILVKAKILQDDNYKIIKSVDGSRVLYDKNKPRVEVYIEKIEDIE